MRNFATLTRMRIQLTLRNKMFLFFTVLMPFAFFFLYAGVFAKGQPMVVKFFLGPVVALTVMGSFWGLSAALVMFREQGILRRFHVTPVTASDMLASSIVANYILMFPTVLLEFFFARSIFHVTNFGDLLATFILISIGTSFFRIAGLGRCQRHQHHAGDSGHQPASLAPANFSLRRHFSSGVPAPRRPKRVFVLAGNLPCAGIATRHFQLDSHLAARRASRLSCFLGCSHFFPVRAAFSLGAGSQSTSQSQTLVVATAIPFLLLGFWENTIRRYPGASSIGVSIH